MTTEDRATVITAIVGLAAVFSEPMSDSRVNSFLSELDRLDANHTMLGIRIYLEKKCQFPNPTDIISNATMAKKKEEPVVGDLTSKEQRDYCMEYSSEFKRKMGW